MSFEKIIVSTPRTGFVTTVELTAAGVKMPSRCCVSRLDIEIFEGERTVACARALRCRQTCHVKSRHIVLVN